MRQQRRGVIQVIGFVLLGAMLVGLGGGLSVALVAELLTREAPAAASVAPMPSAVAVAPAPSARPSPAPTPTALADAPQPAPVAGVPNVRVSAGTYTAHSESSLAQNPRNPLNLVGASKMFTDNANYVFRSGTYVSFDGGRTWTDNGQLPGLEQFELLSDPVVAFDGAGTAYVEVLAATRGRQQRSALYIYRSEDGGRTWSAPILISDDASGFNDKEWLAVDTTGGAHDGTLYTVWVQIAGETYSLYFSRSTDSGRTWSERRLLAADEGMSRQGANVVVGRDGAVHVLWSNLSGSYFESTVSLDGGLSFGPVRRGLPFANVEPLNGNLRRSFVIAGLAADARTAQTLHLVWDDGRLGGSDILYARSADGGATWSAPVVVNGRTRNDQFQPWVASGPDGAVVLQWFDRRDDAGNLLVHTYAARSLDGGRTWSELRVTDVASNPTVGLPMAGDSGFYGDYQALVVDDAGARLFWNETRDGRQEIYSATVAPSRWGMPYRVPEAPPPGPGRRPPQEAEE